MEVKLSYIGEGEEEGPDDMTMTGCRFGPVTLPKHPKTQLGKLGSSKGSSFNSGFSLVRSLSASPLQASLEGSMPLSA